MSKLFVECRVQAFKSAKKKHPLTCNQHCDRIPELREGPPGPAPEVWRGRGELLQQIPDGLVCETCSVLQSLVLHKLVNVAAKSKGPNSKMGERLAFYLLQTLRGSGLDTRVSTCSAELLLLLLLVLPLPLP